MTTDMDPHTTPTRLISSLGTTVFEDVTLLAANRDALSVVQSRVSNADLAAPPVVLPDFHHKSKMELPSSVAVATQNTVRPDLTGSSVNCGMALIALDSDDADPRAVERFMRGVRERFPYPTQGRKDLSAHEVLRAAEFGAEFGPSAGTHRRTTSSASRRVAVSTSSATAGWTGSAPSFPGWPCSWPGSASGPSDPATTSWRSSGSRR